MRWAWVSFISVAFADFYIRLLALGVITDRRSTSRARRMAGPATETHPYDVLVVGAGGAGLRAAIEARAAGASVGLVCKSLLGKAHTVMAEGGVAAALGNVAETDSWQVHFRDTMVGGKLLNEPRMAQLHAQEAPARSTSWSSGAPCSTGPATGRILQRPFGGHSHPRLAHVGDRTGLEMIRTLQDRAVAMGIDVYMECTITHLTTGAVGYPTSDGARRTTGAVGYWRTTGRPILFPAKAVVLATGGIGKAYEVTSNSWEYSGDGQALAYRAGAELIDMEFVQFHPTGMVWPPGVRGLLVTEAVRGEGGILRNSLGERFMWKYLPEDRRAEYAATDEEASRWVSALSEGRQTDARRPPELSTRDNVARAIYTEVREGPRLAARRRPPRHQLPAGRPRPAQAALDVRAVQGARRRRHHEGSDGGRADDALRHGRHPRGRRDRSDDAARPLRGGRGGGRDAWRQPPWRQLAVGPARVRGSNRRRGGFLRLRIADQPHVDPVQIMDAQRELAAPLERTSGEDPYAIARDLQSTMQRLVGIFREDTDLADALAELAVLQTRAESVCVDGGRAYNPGWNLVFELRNLLTISEAVTRSARLRTESRGAHSRLDFPDTDDKRWGKVNCVVSRAADGAMDVRTAPLPKMPKELRALLDAH
jgi:succinate dehydrogenase / fumarate reductase flavoprotein subunit